MTEVKKALVLAALWVAALPAAAALSVVATTSSMGMLAVTVGGDAVKVTVLAPPDRDPHALQARPTMMVALRGADLLVAVGAELEAGWLPAALQGAANGRLQPGSPGYFEAAAQVPLLEAGGAADRSQGDVHPSGNPHLPLDPERMATVASALAGRLGSLDPPRAAAYRERAEGFRKAVASRVAGWRERAKGVPGIAAYHKDVNYLAAFLGVPVLGYVEPLPGIPPSAPYLKELTDRLKGKKGVVVFTDYQPAKGPEFVAKALGWPTVRLPVEPPLPPDAGAYLKLLDRWVEGIASGK